MPLGSKKRKAAKRKNDPMTVDIHQDDSPTGSDANPNVGFFSPVHPPQVNRRDKRLALIEDEGDETFETPRFQPQTPRLLETPYYSMENVRSVKSCEVEGSVEVNPLIGDKSKGLSAGIPLKGMKLDESVGAAAENSNGSRQETSSEEGEGGQDDEASQKESLKGEEAMLEKLEKLDEYVPVDEESTPNEKEEEVHVESEGLVNLRRNVEKGLITNKLTFADNGGLIDDVDSVQEKLPPVDMDMTDNKSEKSVEKSHVPVENTALNTEELNQGNRAYQENAAEPSSHVGKTEAAQRNEVARGPAGARRATFWNCCGLLDVFTGPDR